MWIVSIAVTAPRHSEGAGAVGSAAVIRQQTEEEFEVTNGGKKAN